MAKLDLRRELKHLYLPSAKAVSEVEVPTFTYLMIDGQGDPNSSASYAEALEGLWWADDPKVFVSGDRAAWRWTMMILQPDFVPESVLHAAMGEVVRKKQLPGVARLRIESFAEGHCAQILHIGPFSEEGPTIERLHAYIGARSALRGKHHEIYLTDIRRAAPARWKTIIRQPME